MRAAISGGCGSWAEAVVATKAASSTAPIKALGINQTIAALVGTKADLATDRAVSEKERAAKARAWGCKSVEVSAKTNVGIDEAFTAIITDVLTGDATKGSGGGSVLGAGRTPASELHTALPPKKKACAFL